MKKFVNSNSRSMGDSPPDTSHRLATLSNVLILLITLIIMNITVTILWSKSYH